MHSAYEKTTKPTLRTDTQQKLTLRTDVQGRWLITTVQHMPLTNSVKKTNTGVWHAGLLERNDRATHLAYVWARNVSEEGECSLPFRSVMWGRTDHPKVLGQPRVHLDRLVFGDAGVDAGLHVGVRCRPLRGAHCLNLLLCQQQLHGQNNNAVLKTLNGKRMARGWGEMEGGDGGGERGEREGRRGREREGEGGEREREREREETGKGEVEN